MVAALATEWMSTASKWLRKHAKVIGLIGGVLLDFDRRLRSCGLVAHLRAVAPSSLPRYEHLLGARRLIFMKLHEDWLFRGLIHQTTDEGVFDRLDAGGVTAYIGFDPTASSLHLGHLLPLCNLRRLQIGGNSPIALAGGGTGLIGDPSFKDAERPLLTLSSSKRTLRGYASRCHIFLTFRPVPVERRRDY